MPPLPLPPPSSPLRPTLHSTLGLTSCCFWVQHCNTAGTRTPRLDYRGTPQDRNEGGGGAGRGGSVKNYSEQHRSKTTAHTDERQLRQRKRGRGRELHHTDAGTSESWPQRETEMETGAGVPCKGCQAGGKVRDGGAGGRSRAKSEESSRSRGRLDWTTQQCRDPPEEAVCTASPRMLSSRASKTVWKQNLSLFLLRS